LEKNDLEELAKFAVEHDLIVISDEIYDDITYDGKHQSIAALNGMEERTIVINGFSKCYAMTGWRIGYAAGPQEIIQAMLKVQVYNSTCPVSFTQFAAIEALRGPQDFFVNMREEYRRRRDRMYELLLGIPGMSLVKPKGAIFVFPSVKYLQMKSRQVAERLITKGKVAVVPGNSFGAGGEGYIRITYSALIPRLEEGVRRIQNALATAQAQTNG
jgi:aminotransferase